MLAACCAVGCSAGDGASADPVGSSGTGQGGSVGAPGPGGPSVGGTPGVGGATAGVAPVGNGGSEGLAPVAGLAGQSAGGTGGSSAGAGSVAQPAGAGGVAAGAGGVAAGGGGGTVSAPAVVGCPDSAILCDDFESETVGAFPDGPVWDANSCTSHQVDGAVFHAGARSLRGGAEQYPACMVHANIDGKNELYARSWIRLGADSSESGHEIGFLELGPTLADNPEVRVGVRNNDSVCAQAPGVEVTADGIAGGERTSCSGVALAADRWYCLEVHFARAPGSITFGVQVDGATVVPETSYSEAIAAWTEGPLFLKLGRSSYGGNNVFPVWHDDVIVSPTPVGCEP